MSQANIYITPNPKNPLGVIGEVEANGKKIQGHQLVDVMAQVEAQPNAEEYLFICEGPGGSVDVGDQIHDYMEGLKTQGKRVNTATAGDIGSILTKVFLAGQERTIREGDKFYVHAPWIPKLEGNATQISKELQSLYQEEEKLRGFYKQVTGITDAGLKGLMDGSQGKDGTFITADQAIALRFATKKEGSKVKAFALLKTENMSKKSIITEAVQAFVNVLTGVTSAVAVVPLEAEGGKKLSVSAEDPANLTGADVTDEAGQPAPDGEHKLTDGRVLVVEGGKVKEVKPKAADPATAAAPAAPTTPAPAAVDPNAALAAELAAVKAELASLKAVPPVNVDEKIAAAITEMKNTITAGKKPVAAFNNNGQPNTETQTVALSPIQQKMLEKQKEIETNGLKN